MCKETESTLTGCVVKQTLYSSRDPGHAAVLDTLGV